MAPPPDPLSGIGGALRHAFAIDRDTRSLSGFSDLLARLEQAFERRAR